MVMQRWYIKVVLLLLSAFLLSGSGSAWAEGQLILESGRGSYNLVPYMEILKDPTGAWTAEQVQSPEKSGIFRPYTDYGDPNEGYDQPVHWVRMSVTNESQQSEWLLTVGYPPLDRIDFYVVVDGVPIKHRAAGDLLPYDKRTVRDRNHTFEVHLEPSQKAELLFRIETEGAMSFPMTLSDPVHYGQREQHTNLLLGSYYGIIFAMTLYNAIIALTLGSRSNWYYVAINASVLGLFATFNGISYSYVWPDAVWWNNRAIVAFICIAHAAVLLFTRSFLGLRHASRRLHAGFLYLVGFELLNLLVLVIDYTAGLELSIYTIGLIDAAIILAGVVSMRRGNKRALLFLIGWSVFVCGAMITALTDSGFLPLLPWTNYASQIGSAFEAVVLSWMLAGQISSIKREKELAVEQMKETRRLADSDDLTGLFNRRYIVQAFQALAYRSSARDLSILVLDVDHFKVFNDTYGHDVGDEVLRQLAKTMQECFRPSDIVGRYGGEEFIVLLPGTNVDQARSAAEYFQQTLRSYPFAIGGHTFACTVSIGISEWNGIADDDFERIFRRADEALYEAKRAGRNRICTNVVRPSAWRKEDAQ